MLDVFVYSLTCQIFYVLRNDMECFIVFRAIDLFEIGSNLYIFWAYHFLILLLELIFLKHLFLFNNNLVSKLLKQKQFIYIFFFQKRCKSLVIKLLQLQMHDLYSFCYYSFENVFTWFKQKHTQKKIIIKHFEYFLKYFFSG